MKAKKILLPVDFSTAGEEALKMATSLARDSGATLIVLHVEEPPMAYGGGELYYGLVEPDRTELARMLHEVKPSDPSIPVVYRMGNRSQPGVNCSSRRGENWRNHRHDVAADHARAVVRLAA